MDMQEKLNVAFTLMVLQDNNKELGNLLIQKDKEIIELKNENEILKNEILKFRGY